jgi:UDP-3-O-[3-hydroxymyristoyl] glucosamine N-acyltransferase
MISRPPMRLAEIAEYVNAKWHGEGESLITGLATLRHANSTQISFLANPRYQKDLAQTQAAAVLVTADFAQVLGDRALVVSHPYLAFAKLSQLFDWREPLVPGIAGTATVAETAQVHPEAQICAGAVIAEGVQIAAAVYVGPNTVIGRNCTLGEHTRLEAGVVLYPQVHLGARVLVHSGAILGADGFGFAQEQQQWVKICQLGGVRVDDDVEIGAGTTIDRGALDDTWVQKGVKLDNQIQVAHNVVIGEHSAIAGGTAIAGSTQIGRHCTIAGMSGITGHLTLADHTHITAMTLVSKSIETSGGIFSSGTGVEPHAQWKRNVVRFRQLDELAKRVRRLEQLLETDSQEGLKT